MSSPIIQIENLSIELSGNSILKGVSLDIEKGHYLSIIGPNGAGKTTLIKCIAGIHRGWEGDIRIDDKPFNDYDSRALGRLQSYVPQAEGRSNPLTVADFVAMGRYPHLSAFTTMKADDYAAIDDAIRRAGLDDFRHRKMSTLSGGERQMAFIAAALAQGAEILLLDEPSTFLDYRHQAEVASILRSACRENGITIVAVHHDINTAAASSDRICAIKDGKIIFEGTPAETANAEVLHHIYDAQFEVTPSPHRSLPLITAGGAR
jgi:iron complex transport system ATP-binding protein